MTSDAPPEADATPTIRTDVTAALGGLPALAAAAFGTVGTIALASPAAAGTVQVGGLLMIVASLGGAVVAEWLKT